jgi:hypothetical protein
MAQTVFLGLSNQPLVNALCHILAVQWHNRSRNHSVVSTATEMRDLYIAAEKAVLLGQRVRFGERDLTRADLVEIRNGRREWEARVVAETNASRSGGADTRYSLADFGGTR